MSIHFKKKKQPKYVNWTSQRSVSVKGVREMTSSLNLLTEQLFIYLAEHPEYKLVSHSFIHDCSSSYYDWKINAILEEI